MSDARPCLFCGKMLEPVDGDWEYLQPHGGGEVVFVFAYGSTKHDKFIGKTHYHALLCDDCGEKFAVRMEMQGFGLNGERLDESHAR